MDDTQSPRSELSLQQLLPNLVTVGSICAGMTAIRVMFQGQIELAVALIGLAAILDGLDGRLARLLDSESRIGAELDSLADFLNFGVVPGLLIYVWALHDKQNAGWVAILVYAICCVLRLARFNVQSRSDIPAPPQRYFTGVPAPAGALLVMMPLFASFAVPGSIQWHPLAVALYTVAVGGLMISRVPTFSFKGEKFRAEQAKYIVLGFVVVVAAMASYPWSTLVVIDLLYLGTIAVSWRAARLEKRQSGA